MDKICVHEEQLQALMDASVSTTLAHRGKRYEEYVLGQQEAIANLIYVLCVGQPDSEGLELACQSHAQSAIERLMEIRPPEGRQESGSEGGDAV